jgi:hypothetical protein
VPFFRYPAIEALCDPKIDTVLLSEKELATGRVVRSGLQPPWRRYPPATRCNRKQLPPGNAYLGGPAALALNQGLQVLAGRGLDSLLRKTNDGNWPPVLIDQDARRVTLVIE